MQTVKLYERLAAQAILQRSRDLAVEALTVHPLVGSYPLAQSLVGEFLGSAQGFGRRVEVTSPPAPSP